MLPPIPLLFFFLGVVWFERSYEKSDDAIFFQKVGFKNEGKVFLFSEQVRERKVFILHVQRTGAKPLSFIILQSWWWSF